MTTGPTYNLRVVAATKRGNSAWILIPCLGNQPVNNIAGFVDVVDSSITQPICEPIIFFAGDVVVRLVEQFESLVIPSSPVEVRIHAHVVLDIFPVVNGSLLDLVNRSINGFDGVLFFLVHVFRRSHMLKVSARIAQVRQRMQICGMTTGYVRHAETGRHGKQKHYCC
jgi:hypothetical protein